MYYWWLASIVLLAIAFIWLPSQCSMDAFDMPQGKTEDLNGLEKVDQNKDLEFREDQMWYKIGGDLTFTGLALSYHENGEIRSQTKVKEGKAYGLIEEWDENGTRLGQNFKNEFRVSQ
jgi:antitoxin component YwqK of YwqJK toxin-antitoxin module